VSHCAHAVQGSPAAVGVPSGVCEATTPCMAERARPVRSVWFYPRTGDRSRRSDQEGHAPGLVVQREQPSPRTAEVSGAVRSVPQEEVSGVPESADAARDALDV